MPTTKSEDDTAAAEAVMSRLKRFKYPSENSKSSKNIEFLRFPDLCLELRNHIWLQFMLQDDSRFVPIYIGDCGVFPHKDLISPLLGVNRESRTEARRFYNTRVPVFRELLRPACRTRLLTSDVVLDAEFPQFREIRPNGFLYLDLEHDVIMPGFKTYGELQGPDHITQVLWETKQQKTLCNCPCPPGESPAFWCECNRAGPVVAGRLEPGDFLKVKNVCHVSEPCGHGPLSESMELPDLGDHVEQHCAQTQHMFPNTSLQLVLKIKVLVNTSSEEDYHQRLNHAHLQFLDFLRFRDAVYWCEDWELEAETDPEPFCGIYLMAEESEARERWPCGSIGPKTELLESHEEQPEMVRVHWCLYLADHEDRHLGPRARDRHYRDHHWDFGPAFHRQDLYHNHHYMFHRHHDWLDPRWEQRERQQERQRLLQERQRERQRQQQQSQNNGT